MTTELIVHLRVPGTLLRRADRLSNRFAGTLGAVKVPVSRAAVLRSALALGLGALEGSGTLSASTSDTVSKEP